MSQNARRNRTWSAVFLPLLIASVSLSSAAGKDGKKRNGDADYPKLLNAGTNPTLRYPVMRYSGLSVKSFSCGWFDVTRTGVRYIVVQPENKESEGFDFPISYVYDPRVVYLGNAPLLEFYGGIAGGPKKQNRFLYLPQDRWGAIHTSYGFLSASREDAAGTESIIMAMRNFDSLLATLLTAPIRDGDLTKVKALLRDSPDLALNRDSAGKTPLHITAAQGRKDVAELLLANGADVNAKDNAGATPLHYAVANGRSDVAQLLSEHGGHE